MICYFEYKIEKYPRTVCMNTSFHILSIESGFIAYEIISYGYFVIREVCTWVMDTNILNNSSNMPWNDSNESFKMLLMRVFGDQYRIVRVAIWYQLIKTKKTTKKKKVEEERKRTSRYIFSRMVISAHNKSSSLELLFLFSRTE